MTPEQFLAKLKRWPRACLSLPRPGGIERERCRKALFAAALPEEESREDGFTRHSLDQIPLAAAIDDARSMSLFATQRLDLARQCRSRSAAHTSVAASDDEESPATDVDALTSYLRQPTPGTVLVIDCSRFDFEGEDKTKLERVQKFFAAVPAVVEFRAFSPKPPAPSPNAKPKS